MRQRSQFAVRNVKNKKPRRSEVFFQRYAVGGRRTHCVMSTEKVYALSEEHAISARILMFLSMVQRGLNVYIILLIYTVFIYNVSVRNVLCGGRIVNRRNKVLAETGGAVSA